jgi:hypothetical protein
MKPVIRVSRQFMGRPEPLQLHYTMMDYDDPAQAIAAFPAEPGDVVEFAWWAPISDAAAYRVNGIPQGSP